MKEKLIGTIIEKFDNPELLDFDCTVGAEIGLENIDGKSDILEKHGIEPVGLMMSKTQKHCTFAYNDKSKGPKAISLTECTVDVLKGILESIELKEKTKI